MEPGKEKKKETSGQEITERPAKVFLVRIALRLYSAIVQCYCTVLLYSAIVQCYCFLFLIIVGGQHLQVTIILAELNFPIFCNFVSI